MPTSEGERGFDTGCGRIEAVFGRRHAVVNSEVDWNSANKTYGTWPVFSLRYPVFAFGGRRWRVLGGGNTYRLRVQE